MRVIAGIARGRHLHPPPPGAATRPTSDKVREALFNILGDGVQGARVLDLFAGTGALGIEALSRGAERAVFVDADRKLCRTVEKNLETVGFADRAEVLCRDVRRAASALATHGPFDLVLIDPPYQQGLEREAVGMLLASALLSPGATVVVEHASRDKFDLFADVPGAREALEPAFARTYGDTALTAFRAAGPLPVSETQGAADVVANDGAAREAESHTEPGAAAMTRTAIYPGSFDPMTNGHLDVIRRSLNLFDRLVIAVAVNIRKQGLFSVQERIDLIREVLGDDPRVEIDTFEGLLVEYAKRKGAVALVRGLRAVADFEYEFEMASMNRKLAPNVETVFLMTDEKNFYVSSHLVKEVASLGGEIDGFVPAAVAPRLRERVRERKGG